MNFHIDNERKGDLMKVTHVDQDSGTVFLRLTDGRTAWINGIDSDALVKNDTILVCDGDWFSVPPEVWPTNYFVSVLHDVLEDGTILGESGNGILPLTNPNELSVFKNCTVEINGTSEIVRILSHKPIRIRQDFTYDETSASSFLIDPNDKNLSFEDFGGYKDVVDRARELIETQLYRREELSEIGARSIRGILFTGPPGTGKTHLARIIADQSDAAFYQISGPSIVSKWVGDSENLLRRIFEDAQNSSLGKSIIFFDEIDSIAESRGGDTHEASRRLVAQFLTLMDGFSNAKSTTIIIAATNRVEALDPALMRPGRFDWEIEFGMPTVLDRVDILNVGARRVKCNDNLPILEVAIRTHNWSAARLSLIWAEAALIAAADRRNRIAGEDFAQAYERVARRPERSQSKENS